MLLSLAQVAVLRGKMVFSISQVAGRVGAIPLNLLSKHNGGKIREDLRRALLWWVEAAVHRAKPRTVKAGDERRPILIFTDGAHEETETGYGGVMIDPEDNEVAAFGRNMGKHLQARLSVAGKKKANHWPSRAVPRSRSQKAMEGENPRQRRNTLHRQ